jgi:hypothetical protein
VNIGWGWNMVADMAVAIRFSLENIKDGRALQGGELPRLPPAKIEQIPIQRATRLVTGLKAEILPNANHIAEYTPSDMVNEKILNFIAE